MDSGVVENRAPGLSSFLTSNTFDRQPNPQLAESEGIISLDDAKRRDQREKKISTTGDFRTWLSSARRWWGRGFHLIAKLQLVRRQHDDVVVYGQHSLRLDLVVGEETVTQLVLFGSHHFERDVDLGPKRLC